MTGRDDIAASSVDVVRFAVLGLGAGGVYALTAQGVVLIYRGSGVVNFAQGAIGMIGAYVVYLSHEDGIAIPVALALGVGLGAAIGAATHLLVMRPLRHAPAVSRLVATLGILTVCLALGEQLWGHQARLIDKLLPTDSVTLFDDVVVGEDRLLILAVAVVVTAALALLYRATRFGLATSAVAESRRATSAQGISPDVIATVNWALGGSLAVAAAVLIVNITGLQVLELTLLVVPALAAALVGGFRSFPLTLIGGLLIGILESEVAYLQVEVGTSALLQGAADSVPFLVIIVVLVVRGRALPLRGDALEKPAELGTGVVRPSWAVLLTAAALAVAVLAPSGWVDALTTTAAVGIILLSLVVVTGYTGQLSLAQVALAGMGAWIAARLVATQGVPFELAALAGIAGAVPIGVLVGLAALRTRGVNLAVVTLGLALVLERQVLANSDLTGGALGTQVGAPSFLGIDLDTLEHPARYAALAIAAFLLAFACGRQPAAEPDRPPARRGAHERAGGCRARRERLRRQALRLRARVGARRGGRHPARVRDADRHLLADVRRLRVDLGGGLRGDRGCRRRPRRARRCGPRTRRRRRQAVLPPRQRRRRPVPAVRRSAAPRPSCSRRRTASSCSTASWCSGWRRGFGRNGSWSAGPRSDLPRKRTSGRRRRR